MTVRVGAFLGAALLAIVAGLLIINSGQPLTGPPTHPWAEFRIGSWVARRETVGGQVSNIREELLEIGPETVRLRIATEIGGKTESEEVSMGLRDEEWSREGFTAGAEERVGRFRARRFERGGETRWFSDELPAWPVRIQRRDPDGTTIETRVVRLEARSVAGRDVACVVFEEVRIVKGQEASRYYEWRSQEVPGHFVARRGLMDGIQVVHEAVDFGVKP